MKRSYNTETLPEIRDIPRTLVQNIFAVNRFQNYFCKFHSRFLPQV